MGTPTLRDMIARLLKERIVFIGTPIDDAVATETVANLLFLQMENRAAPVRLHINSPGGSVTASRAVLDTMSFLTPPIHTTCIGQAFGCAAQILAHGSRGHREALPNARIGFDELWGGSVSSPGQAQEIARLRTEFIQQMAKDTGRLPGLIEGDMKRGCHLTAAEAVDYGIIDRVVDKSV